MHQIKRYILYTHQQNMAMITFSRYYFLSYNSTFWNKFSLSETPLKLPCKNISVNTITMFSYIGFKRNLEILDDETIKDFQL